MMFSTLSLKETPRPTSPTLKPLLAARGELEIETPNTTPLSGFDWTRLMVSDLLLPVEIASSIQDLSSAVHHMKKIWADVDGPRPLEIFSNYPTLVDQAVLQILERTFSNLESRPIHSLCEDDFKFVGEFRTFVYGALYRFELGTGIEDIGHCQRWCKIMSSCLKDKDPANFTSRLWHLVNGMNAQTQGFMVRAALGKGLVDEHVHGEIRTLGTRFSRRVFWYSFRLYLQFWAFYACI